MSLIFASRDTINEVSIVSNLVTVSHFMFDCLTTKKNSLDNTPSLP